MVKTLTKQTLLIALLGTTPAHAMMGKTLRSAGTFFKTAGTSGQTFKQSQRALIQSIAAQERSSRVSPKTIGAVAVAGSLLAGYQQQKESVVHAEPISVFAMPFFLYIALNAYGDLNENQKNINLALALDWIRELDTYNHFELQYKIEAILSWLKKYDFTKETKKQIAEQILSKKGSALSLSLQQGLSLFLSPEQQALFSFTDHFQSLKELLDQETNIRGPLFSSYSNRYEEEIRTVFESEAILHPNIKALLWDVIDFVKSEYQDERIVFFHGRNASAGFAAAIFEELIQFKDDNFKHLRFTKDKIVKDEHIHNITSFFTQTLIRIPLFYFSHVIPMQSSILFVNLHLFANTWGSNSLHYFSSNSDRSSSMNALFGNFHEKKLKEMFEEKGLLKEFEFLESQKNEQGKTVFEELSLLYREAVEEQGNCGQLLVISMPKKLARKICYPAMFAGRYRTFTINNSSTDDVVTIAENYDQMPFENWFCIILTKEMLDPIEAQKAGVKIKAFDPVIYQQTEKFLKFEKRLKEVMAEVKRLYTQRMAEQVCPEVQGRSSHSVEDDDNERMATLQ